MAAPFAAPGLLKPARAAWRFPWGFKSPAIVRQRQSSGARVPLFPLERTFFPQETEKLFVFEPRYRVSAFSHAQRHSGSGVPSRVTG